MGPIKPGDRFFAVLPNHGQRPPSTYWVRVIKVGRRWADFEYEGRSWRKPDHRFDMEDFMIDAGQFSSPGRVYRSEEDYHESVHRQALWKDLRRQVSAHYSVPVNLTKLDILKAADALGFRLKEE